MGGTLIQALQEATGFLHPPFQKQAADGIDIIQFEK